MKRAEIIPTVLDTFQPLLTISISWPAKNATVDYGNTINPTSVQEVPIISFVDAVPGSEDKHNTHPQLTLALTDPDAPSRDNPEWSQVCHWIITNVPLDSHSSGSNEDDFTESKHRMKEIMPYKSPGPPPKTGKHRYVFVALSPLNRTIETLDLVAPSDRRRWGFEEERKGLRTWMAEMGLGVVGESIFALDDLISRWRFGEGIAS